MKNVEGGAQATQPMQAAQAVNVTILKNQDLLSWYWISYRQHSIIVSACSSIQYNSYNSVSTKQYAIPVWYGTYHIGQYGAVPQTLFSILFENFLPTILNKLGPQQTKYWSHWNTMHLVQKMHLSNLSEHSFAYKSFHQILT